MNIHFFIGIFKHILYEMISLMQLEASWEVTYCTTRIATGKHLRNVLYDALLYPHNKTRMRMIHAFSICKSALFLVFCSSLFATSILLQFSHRQRIYSYIGRDQSAEAEHKGEGHHGHSVELLEPYNYGQQVGLTLSLLLIKELGTAITYQSIVVLLRTLKFHGASHS